MLGIWKYSRLRFYILNAKWNVNFYLHCKRIYKTINYQVNINDYTVDIYQNMQIKRQNVTKQRFAGYMFNNALYLDNPGIKISDRKTWQKWKNKKLI